MEPDTRGKRSMRNGTHDQSPRATSAPAWSDEKIREIVRDLESLRNGSYAAAALIGCGPRVVPFLREFLLQGKPRGIFQPRRLAVETLAELGAKDVIVEYIEQARTRLIEDPVVRFGEGVVESTAARTLSRWLTDHVSEALSTFAEDRLLIGLVEALGMFKRAEMAPYFLWALGDDECGEAAEEALRKLGNAARMQLIEGVKIPDPSADEEIPSSRIRRRKLLRLLAEERVSADEWLQLRVLLDERDLEIAITCARIAIQNGFVEDQRKAICRLVSSLQEASWFLRTEVRSCLIEHYEVAREQVDAEIARRRSFSMKAQRADLVLRLLLNLKTQGNRNIQ